jgi:AcrR family transcriptional regulator
MRRNTVNSPRKIPKQDRAWSTVEAIIEATTRIIEEDGLEGLTTNRAARLAGVSVGSLYQYFPNKEALVEEVRSRFAERFQTRLLELVGRLGGLDLRGAIREWVVTLVELHTESPGVHNAVGRGAPADTHGAFATVVGGFLDARAEETRRPDRALAGRILIDASEALIHNTALRDPARLKDEGWVDEVCELLQRYLVRDAAG